MGGNLFVIEELDVLGGATPPNGYQRFEWSAAKRSMPLRPWRFGLDQRTVRTDYAGSGDPSEQILGPSFTEFSLSGRWDDRYNPRGEIPDGASGAEAYAAVGGYAVAEWKRFEALVARGNPVRITFEDITVQGVIKNATFDYHYRAKIGYSFTVSPHHRAPGGFFSSKRSPRSTLNATQLRDEVAVPMDEAAVIWSLAPQAAMAGTIYLEAEAVVDQWADLLGQIDAGIEQRTLTPELEPYSSLLRLAALFYTVATSAQSMIELLKGEDSTTAVGYLDVGAVTAFDEWSRGLMFFARQLIVAGRRAAADISQRAEPNAIGLYRPQFGEHLYSISNRFYGTAHNWRIIAERNHLLTTVLDGTELLIIPEAIQR